jgi:multidrug efflux pump subunit AcrA (membrane-fusion protein)
MGAATIALVVAAIIAIGPSKASSRTITETITAADGVVQTTVSGSGNVEPGVDDTLNFGTSGTLKAVYVKVGQHVKQGQLLAELNPAAAQLSLDQAEQQLTAAQDNLSSAESGSSTGGSSGTTGGSGSGGSSTATAFEGSAASEFVSFPRVTAPEASTASTSTTPTGTTTTPTSTATTPTSTTTTPTITTTTTTTTPTKPTRPSRPATPTTPSSSGTSTSSSSRYAGGQSRSGTGGSTSGTGASRSGTSGSGSSGVSSTPSPGTIASDQASVDSAKASLASAKEALAETKLYAPISGTVVSLASTAPGETVSAGSGGSSGSSSSPASSSSSSGGSGLAALAAGTLGGGSSSSSSSSGFAEIINTKQLTMTVPLSESDIAAVKVGQSVNVTLDALSGVELAAHVSSISPMGTESSGVVSYNVTITLDQSSSQVRPGMSAEASIITAQASGVTLPSAAVSGTGSEGTVQVLSGGHAVTKEVIVGLRGDSRAQIVSGLSAGQDVRITETLPALGTASSSTGSSSSTGTLGGSSGLPGGGGFLGGGGGGFLRRALGGGGGIP